MIDIQQSSHRFIFITFSDSKQKKNFSMGYIEKKEKNKKKDLSRLKRAL